MARGLVPRGHLLASCHRERSVNCHGEESFKTTRPSCFCHYERSEVIKKQVLLANRLRLSLRFFAMTKGLRQVPLRVTKNLQQASSQVTSFSYKILVTSSIVSDKKCGTRNLRQVYKQLVIANVV